MSMVLGGRRALVAHGWLSRMASASASASESKSASKTRKSPGLSKEFPVSAALHNFVGAPEISRVAVMKKVWEYIKHNQLQNPQNKREIICDKKLKSLFAGKDRVGMLEISKLLSPHFVKPN